MTQCELWVNLGKRGAPGRTSKRPKSLAASIGEGTKNLLFSGSSAFLLLIANLFSEYWYFSFFALTPFLWKISRATPRSSFHLGFLFGLLYLTIYQLDSLVAVPLASTLQIISGSFLFALFGWAIGCIKEKSGFNPVIIALLWVSFELGTFKLGLWTGFFEPVRLANALPFTHGLALLGGFCVISFVLVLFNSLLLVAVKKIISLAKARGQYPWETERIWDLSPIPGLSAQKIYFIPSGRAPPISSQ